jgi:hypothetical protein
MPNSRWKCLRGAPGGYPAVQQHFKQHPPSPEQETKLSFELARATVGLYHHAEPAPSRGRCPAPRADVKTALEDASLGRRGAKGCHVPPPPPPLSVAKHSEAQVLLDAALLLSSLTNCDRMEGEGESDHSRGADSAPMMDLAAGSWDIPSINSDGDHHDWFVGGGSLEAAPSGDLAMYSDNDSTAASGGYPEDQYREGMWSASESFDLSDRSDDTSDSGSTSYYSDGYSYSYSGVSESSDGGYSDTEASTAATLTDIPGSGSSTSGAAISSGRGGGSEHAPMHSVQSERAMHGHRGHELHAAADTLGPEVHLRHGRTREPRETVAAYRSAHPPAQWHDPVAPAPAAAPAGVTAAPAAALAVAEAPPVAAALLLPQHSLRADTAAVDPSATHARVRAARPLHPHSSEKHSRLQHPFGQQPPIPRDLHQPESLAGRPVQKERVAQTIKDLIETVASRDRSTRATEMVWLCAQTLLRDESYVFEERPVAFAGERGVFREAPKVRRPFHRNGDKWQNSGGKKGSTVWTAKDTSHEIMRCSYGKIKRVAGPDLRYHEYSFTKGAAEAAEASHLLDRRLFVCVPSDTRRQMTRVKPQGKVAADTGGKDPDQFSTSEIDEALARLDEQAMQTREISMTAVVDLLEQYGQPAMANCNPSRHRRPDVMIKAGKRIFVERGLSRRRTQLMVSANGKTAEQWINSGGKNAVVVLKASDQRVHRRSGTIKPRFVSGDNEQVDLRYHQYTLETAGGAKRGTETVTLYHVFGATKYRGRRKPSMTKHDREQALLPVKDDRPEKRRATPSAKASLAVASIAAVLALVAYSGVGPSLSLSDDAVCPVGYFASNPKARTACTPCRDCSAQALGTVRACTASADTTCEDTWRWEAEYTVATPARWINFDTGISRALHLPQMAAIWQSESSLYAFGGASDMSKVKLSHERLAAGEQCTTDNIGVSDILWRFDASAGWMLLQRSTNDGRVWPRRRYAATSWSLDSHGLLYSGEFEFCHHEDYDGSGSYFPAPDITWNTPTWCVDCGVGFSALYAKCPTRMGSCDWNCTAVVAQVIQNSDQAPVNRDLHNEAAAAVFRCMLDASSPKPQKEPFSHKLSDGILGPNAHLYFVPPDSLYLAVPGRLRTTTTPSWKLLGGSDMWQHWSAAQLSSAFADGYSQSSCDDHGASSASCVWPLPRSRAQAWTLDGMAYMFSGLLSIVDGSFENAEKMTLLHNDLWRFDADSGSEVATRVAACGSNIQRPSIIRPSRPYPGPRFGAATWVHEQGGWMFGGIGRRYSSYRGFEYGDNCNLDDIVGSTAVTNMCDVWQLTPGEGFRLVAACERDLPELNDAGLVPSTIVPAGGGPDAGLFTTAWVGPTLAPGAGQSPGPDGQSLWLFGGITSCAAFNGVGPAGTLLKEYTGSLSRNVTMCNLVEPLHQVNIALVGNGFPNQPCTADLWRFDLSSESWTQQQQRPLPRPGAHGSAGWPTARCGAHALSGKPDHENTASATILGGWAGPGGGECEAWASCDAFHEPGIRTPRQQEGNPEINNAYDAGYSAPPTADDECAFKSFESTAFPADALPSRVNRMRAATCMPLTEIWRWRA